MTDAAFEKLNSIDREKLMDVLAENLIIISGKMDMTPSGIAWRAGIDKERMAYLSEKKRKMKWSEYLSILFVLWEDEVGRNFVEELGLFPEELKNVVFINRNSHEDDLPNYIKISNMEKD